MIEEKEKKPKPKCNELSAAISKPANLADMESKKPTVNPGTQTFERVEDLSKFEDLYKMLSGVKRMMTMEEVGIPPEVYLRPDLDEKEKSRLLAEDRTFRECLSLEAGIGFNNTGISRAIIREAEQVFLKDQEKFLWVEVEQNNMYFAVTWSTGNRQEPIVVKFYHYERLNVMGDDIRNIDIFNAIGMAIQSYINTGCIKQEFEDQNSIPIVFCFSDFVDCKSALEKISQRVGPLSTFKKEIVGKNYCKEFADTVQLIISEKKIDYTTVVPIHSGNFMSFYCFDTFPDNKRPHANYAFLRGASVQEFVKCRKVEKQKFEGMNLKQIYPDSVLERRDSQELIISNSFFRIGQNEGYERNVIYRFLTKFERFTFDSNAEIRKDIYAQMASPLRLCTSLQNYIRNHPLFLAHPKLEEEPIVDMKRFDYFLQTDYKDHGSILHPLTFELIGLDIHRFCEFLMKRCLSFSSLALLATIERKYYLDIEPEYPSGSTPVVRISIREGDRGVAEKFEESIVEYLENGARIFWNQRRQDLESPKFEIISDFNCRIVGNHILTKYLRTLIPRDYWVRQADKTDRVELEGRKKEFQKLWNSKMSCNMQQEDQVKQAIDNVAIVVDELEHTELPKCSDTGERNAEPKRTCVSESKGQQELKLEDHQTEKVSDIVVSQQSVKKCVKSSIRK